MNIKKTLWTVFTGIALLAQAAPTMADQLQEIRQR
ncbi:amino acid ABC transporter substrate-binding protein, partial [Klebsiella pneumoniae]|nr:amino acid ABC transporter substrate-binding protein [Klebsiella pneumoniae]